MSLAEQFMDLFSGLVEAHGCYRITGQQESGKRTGQAVTVREPVTLKLWEDHLNGRESLGIVPINRDSQCRFGAIDIDVYPIDHLALVTQVATLKLPLNVFRSKSGGAHLFLFVSEPIAASRMQELLKSYCAALKLQKAEVFPKQKQLHVDRGDMGNWINMPYYGHERTLLDTNAQAVPIDVFFATVRIVSAKEVKEYAIDLDSGPIVDGPPCLQTLAASGFPEGSRNNGLFALATYGKRAFPDFWKGKIKEWNRTLLNPPLSDEEVGLVIKQVEKNDYGYKCHDQPINMYCNVALCRRRKYGIGNNTSMLPIISGVTQYQNPEGGSAWWLDLEGGQRIKVTTDELDDQGKFRRRLMDVARMRPNVKPVQWDAFVSSIMSLSEKSVVSLEHEDTAAGQFIDLLRVFIEVRSTNDITALETGRVYIDKGVANFRLKDLMLWMERKRFDAWDITQLNAQLHAMGRTLNRLQTPQGYVRVISMRLKDLGIAETEEVTEKKEEVL